MAFWNQTVLYVPSSRPTPIGFGKLFELCRQADQAPACGIDFSRCSSIHQHSVAILGGLIRRLKQRGAAVDIEWDSCRPQVLHRLQRNGFSKAFGGPASIGPSADENAVRYREDRRKDALAIVGYLQDDWLGHGWIDISDQLRDKMVGRAWEIYENAFEHSGSDIGVTTCGHHYPLQHELSLTVVDFGRSIPTNVRRHFSNDSIPSVNALAWALRAGTTTKPIEKSGGLGLDLLREFVRVNHGRLEIFSGDGYVRVEASVLTAWFAE